MQQNQTMKSMTSWWPSLTCTHRSLAVASVIALHSKRILYRKYACQNHHFNVYDSKFAATNSSIFSFKKFVERRKMIKISDLRFRN